MLLYHGVLAPRARWRSQVVSYGRPDPDLKAQEVNTGPRIAGAPDAWRWATLMRRVFAFNGLACPRCGGRPRVIATVHAPRVAPAILASLARSGAPAPPGPTPPAPAALT